MEWTNLLSRQRQVERETEPPQWRDYPISDFEIDYKSIIMSAAFRRLQDKTQVFPLDKSDFVRTRLTHSIEVSTIARQLGIMVTQNKTKYLPLYFKEHPKATGCIPTILSCAGLLHDLGNPPFGHFGEVVIGGWFAHELCQNTFRWKGKAVKDLLSPQMASDLMNFEGNAQALRILSKVRQKPDGYDANLTFSVMNTLIKYPTDSLHIDDSTKADVKRHKMGYFFAEKELFETVCIKNGTQKADGSYARHPLAYLMEAADDIAYSTSDLEDSLKKGMFTVDEFISYFESELSAREIGDREKKNKTIALIEDLKRRLHAQERNAENDFIAFQNWTGYAKRWFMHVVAFSFSKNYTDIMQGEYEKDLFDTGFHRFSIQILKDAMKRFVFDSPQILKLELAADKILSSLLNDFIYAVFYWDAQDEKHSLAKAEKKLISIIPDSYKNDYFCSRGKDDATNLYLRFLMVTDFISGMTDSYAKNLYRELNGID